MTAFGGIFRSRELEGVEESGENGQRGRVTGLDLESGVIRVRPARREAAADTAGTPAEPDPVDEIDPAGRADGES